MLENPKSEEENIIKDKTNFFQTKKRTKLHCS